MKYEWGVRVAQLIENSSALLSSPKKYKLKKKSISDQKVRSSLNWSILVTKKHLRGSNA